MCASSRKMAVRKTIGVCRSALARADQGGGLVAVHPRHVQVEQDDARSPRCRSGFSASSPERATTSVVAELLQRLDRGEGVALVVVDDEDPAP